MRVKKGFINRNVCGESVLLATGQENIDFTNIISLNETANFLWKELAQREDFTIDDMVELLTGEYEVEADEAKADCQALVQQWTDAGIWRARTCPRSRPTSSRKRHRLRRKRRRKQHRRRRRRRGSSANCSKTDGRRKKFFLTRLIFSVGETEKTCVKFGENA